jgi:hypothetical protein
LVNLLGDAGIQMGGRNTYHLIDYFISRDRIFMQVDFEFRARKGVTRTKRRREARSDGLKAYVEDGSS